jgi:competence protein ComEA
MNTTLTIPLRAVPFDALVVSSARFRAHRTNRRRVGPGVRTPLVKHVFAKSVAAAVLTLFLTFSFAVRGFAAPVDVNTADAVSLSDALSGVGPKIAEAIVVYRKENGPFTAVDDLLNVKGIGPRILERNKADIRIGEQSSSSTAE